MLAICAILGVLPGDAEAQGTGLVLTVTPTEFYQDTPANVTVTVRDASGNPVANASIYFGILDMDAYGGSLNPYLLASFGSSLGWTDATGTFRTTYTPGYGTPMHLIIYAETASAESGYADLELNDEPGSDFDVLNALEKYGFLMACLIVVPVTLGGWYGSTMATRKRFESAKLMGFNRKFADAGSESGTLRHIEGRTVFDTWKSALRDSKDTKLFVSARLLRSFTYKGARKHYACAVRGDEEVEYFSTEVQEQRVHLPFKLHADPKPSPPAKFTAEDDVQSFPVSERVDSCGRCKATGQITCDKCKGDAKKQCPVCQGTGRSRCEKCWGYGYYTTTPSSQPGGKWSTTGASFGTPHAMKCERCDGKGKAACEPCKGRGYFPCEKCDGTGKMTCTLCEGDRQTRHLTCKVWRYKHESHREVFGPEGFKSSAGRFDEIEGEAENPHGALDGATPTASGEAQDATPKIQELLAKARASYAKWASRKKGKVVKDKHDLLISPVTACEAEYPAKEGSRKFTIWAIGNARAWVLDAGETPTKLTARYAARHVAFGLLLVAEFVVILFVAGFLKW